MSIYHNPIMLDEVLKGLDIKPGEKYIDATLGGGGHTKEILARGGLVLGIDADKEAFIENDYLNKLYGKGKFREVQGNFRNIYSIAEKESWKNISGILFDLGVSSHQLDTPNRGFSFRYPEMILDMRFDNSSGEKASKLLESLTKDGLYEIFAKYSEEKYSRTIADAVYRTRSIKQIIKVNDFVELVKNEVGARRAIEMMPRLFQALRIAVNDEIGALRAGLYGAELLLKPEGKLVVISFHSLEDRIVKLWMNRSGWKKISTKPIKATVNEIEINPRARSAKVRIAQKI
jgi:16S rRNA (cytosine1402-N4)-methyltransferase